MKFLYQPVKPFILTQRFGENNACVDLATGRLVITADGNNPPPGFRSLYGPTGHKGIDLAAKHGQPVYAAHAGKVYHIDTKERSGLDVRVEGLLDGVPTRAIYEHLLGYQKRVGDRVAIGDLIGWADNTGYSSGDHLHFEVQQLISGAWVSVDPMKLMANAYALDVAPLYDQLKELLAQLADLLSEQLRKTRR